MVRRVLSASVVLLLLLLSGPDRLQAAASAGQSASLDRVAWVADVIQQMATITPGMTRADLMKIFTTEGGFSSRSKRTFVSRECPYFKVDVEFELVGPANSGASYCIPVPEFPPCDPTVPIFSVNDQDRIIKISKPYLALMIMD